MRQEDGFSSEKRLRMVTVIPAFNAERTLNRCLDALFASGIGSDEIVVVNDGSRDATANIAKDAQVHLIEKATPEGPGPARNTGVQSQDADIVLFVDADVEVHPDAPERIRAAFGASDIVAVFGSYDDEPPEVSVVSRYRNLLHHHVHQMASHDAETFWTGLGAVRMEAFREIGGFDPAFTTIEDIDLGLRLRANGGAVRLDAGIQGKHLKTWTIPSMIRTDFWDRAVPWVGLMRNSRIPGTTLNAGWRHRISAACVAAAIVFLFLGFFWPFALLASLAATLGFVAANAGFLRFLARTGGVGFAIRALPYHAIHYLTGLAGYLYVLLQGAR